MGSESTPSAPSEKLADEPADATLVGTHSPGSTGDPHRPALNITRGDVIGRYLAVHLVGTGANGVVWSAYDGDLDRRVAIKLLARRPAERDDARKWLLAEAQAMAKIRHPNVVAIYDVGTHDGHLYLAMEFVEGTTLGRWCKDETRSRADIIDAYTAAARGLAAAHSAGLVHRDFKPDNVLVDRDGRVRVADFGLAAAPSTEQRRSAPARVSGTPAYMSPEHHSGNVDAKSDQFSFCIALCEALTGRRPFGGVTLAELAVATLRGTIDPAVASLLPSRVRPVVLRGLAREAADRHASMDALVEALERTRRPRWPWALGAAAAIGAIAALGLALQPEVPTTTCASGAVRIAAAWGDDQRKSMRITPGEYAPSYAATVTENIGDELDRRAQRWAEVHDSVCAATMDAPTDPVSVARRACVEDRLASFTGTTTLLGTREVDVDTADRLLGALPDPSECEREDVVAWEPIPPEPELAARVASIRARLRESHLHWATGDLARGIAEAEPVLADARATEYPHLIASALTELASYDDAIGHHETARQRLDEAIEVAISAGHDWLAATILIDRIEHEARSPLQDRGVVEWTMLARAFIARSGSDPQLVGRLETVIGARAFARGDFEGAVQHELAALAALEAAPNVLAQALGNAHLNAALALSQLNRAHESWEHAEIGRKILDAAGRPSPRDVLRTLHLFAVLDMSLGRPDAAIEKFHAALAKAEAFYGRRGPTVSGIAYNLANALALRGRDADARAAMARSYEAWPKVDDEFADGEFEVGEAVLDWANGEPALALVHIDRALELWADTPEEYGQAVSGAKRSRARILVELGDHAGALGVLEAEYRRFGTTVFVGPTDFVDAMLAARARGDSDARALWLARSEAGLGRDPGGVAIKAFVRALASDDVDGATLQAVREARVQFAALNFEDHPLVRQMDAWLAASATRDPSTR